VDTPHISYNIERNINNPSSILTKSGSGDKIMVLEHGQKLTAGAETHFFT
jgi:hypothetical protein